MSEIRIGVIGGTGLGEALTGQGGGARHEIDTPFGRPSDAIIMSEWSGVPVLCLSRHGPGHLINPSQVPFRANIFGLKQLGCTHIIASGAVGSLREHLRPRDLVIPDQIIDKTCRRAGTFYEKAAVHVEFAEPFCGVLRRMLIEAGTEARRHEGTKGTVDDASSSEPATSNAFTVHDGGCYVCMEGPAFSTRAESLTHRLWGGDLIGMTAMPEAKLAREAEISYALVALVTDYDCWMRPQSDEATQRRSDEGQEQLLNQILGNLEAARGNAIAVIRRAVELAGQWREELAAAPARNSLRLAVWSDRSRIAPEEIERLRPLWGRYFQ